MAAVLLAGCAALGGTQAAAPPAADGGAPTPVRVSIMPTTDLAPLHLAERNGWFAEEGLDVETVTVPSGQASIQSLIGGDVDIAYSSYGPFFVALDKGAADLRFVADASSLSPDSSVVVAMPGSGVGSVADLAGKRIAVTAAGSISDALVKSAMRESGVDFSGVQWVSIPFPDTPAALERGDVDAAFLTEPFVTLAERGVGAVVVVDTSTGPATGLPTAGYASLAGFSEQNPATVAAFRRVLQRAVDASADRDLVNPLLVEYSKVDAQTAAAATLLDFHAEPRADQLQRVPDLLLEFGVIGEPLDVAPLIAPVDG
ncbi:ABC transporter substrate-binding protein [Pseudonocardia lacus]|uniref:ABC transporter substrate-binding protein n=1 Tax=Pseudonocardia lacus TaxID=2835865 RepID=UPI0027E290D2|nr:ABC transporter substrate-binding protein [Pseudonocardia lacus]